MKIEFVQILVASLREMHVTPINPEANVHSPAIALECKQLAEFLNKTVICHDNLGNRQPFINHEHHR